MDKMQIAGTSGSEEKTVPVSGNSDTSEPYSVTVNVNLNSDEAKQKIEELADLMEKAAALADELAFLIGNLEIR